MAHKLKWDKTKRARETEPAFPQEPDVSGPQTHVKRAPVRRWADMTPEERQAVEESLRRK